MEKTKKCSSADFENYTQEVLFDVSLNNKDAEDFGLGKLILHKFENLSKLTIVVSKEYIRIKKKGFTKMFKFRDCSYGVDKNCITLYIKGGIEIIEFNFSDKENYNKTLDKLKEFDVKKTQSKLQNIS